jgi:4-amino-4-deoxy-L-arabinose transferase-like glycosyltransferase
MPPPEVAPATEPSQASPPARRGALRAILVLLAIAAVVKLAVLVMPPEEISRAGIPQPEEWRRGMAAQEWLDGPLLPYLDYQQGHFQGGTLLTIGLDAISYALFGGSPLTMRLPNLLYDWVTIACLFLVVDRLASRRAAWIAGLLAAVPSPGYQMVGSMAWAAHNEANAFAMALLCLWVRHVFGGRNRPHQSFFLGVVAGLALWYHYALVVWLAPMLIIEFLRDRRAWIRPAMGLRLAGLVVGLLPWWAYNLTHDWKGLGGIYGRSAAGHFQDSAADIAATFSKLITHFLPHSLYLPHLGGLGPILEVLLFTLFALAWLVVSLGALRAFVREREVRAELVLFGYVVLWTFLYTFGTFHGEDWWVSGYRYMMPLHPVAWIATGLVLVRAPLRVQYVATGCMLFVFAAGTVSFLRPDHAHANATAPGHIRAGLGRFLFLRAGEEPDVLVGVMHKALAEREPAEAEEILFTLGNCLLWAADATPPDSITDPDVREFIEERARQHGRTLEALHAAAPERIKPYFSRLREGERTFEWSERAEFWRQWDRRGEPRPPGAYSD